MLIQGIEHGYKLIILGLVKAGFKSKSVINAADEAIFGYILAVFNFVAHIFPNGNK